jgi:hypothetical protein
MSLYEVGLARLTPALAQSLVAACWPNGPARWGSDESRPAATDSRQGPGRQGAVHQGMDEALLDGRTTPLSIPWGHLPPACRSIVLACVPHAKTRVRFAMAPTVMDLARCNRGTAGLRRQAPTFTTSRPQSGTAPVETRLAKIESAAVTPPPGASRLRGWGLMRPPKWTARPCPRAGTGALAVTPGPGGKTLGWLKSLYRNTPSPPPPSALSEALTVPATPIAALANRGASVSGRKCAMASIAGGAREPWLGGDRKKSPTPGPAPRGGDQAEQVRCTKHISRQRLVVGDRHSRAKRQWTDLRFENAPS